MNLSNDNPADRVRPVLGPQRDIVQHRQALRHREVAAALATVRASRKKPAVKLAFDFLVLTAARSERSDLAAWGEIDHNGPCVDDPGHPDEDEPRPPSAALRSRDGCSRRGADARRRPARVARPGWAAARHPAVPPVDGTLRHRLRSTRLPLVVPRLAAEETDHRREVIEAGLAHVVQNQVEAACARSDLFERLLLLMDDWAAYLNCPPVTEHPTQARCRLQESRTGKADAPGGSSRVATRPSRTSPESAIRAAGDGWASGHEADLSVQVSVAFRHVISPRRLREPIRAVTGCPAGCVAGISTQLTGSGNPGKSV